MNGSTDTLAFQRAALIVATVLAASLRLPGLEASPPGFFCDEASVGYDAVSLLETGADQYGRVLPLFARSFGDYDEASYRYLTVPFVALLGPTVVATRLPAALAGLALVPLCFFLARRWFGPAAAIAAAFFVATSPWLLLFSRVAFRGILLPAAFTLALVLYERARERRRGTIGVAIAFAAALWTYSPARVLVPAWLILTLAIDGRELWRTQRRELLGGGVLFAAWIAALGSFWISPEGMARANSELRGSAEGWWRDYASYFSYEFLIREGDPNLRHSLRGWGQMLPFEAVTIAWGLFVCLRARSRPHALLLAWTAIAVVPASLTMEMHALRAIGAAPALTLLSALGVASLLETVRRVAVQRVLAGTALAAWLAVAFVPMRSAIYVDYPRYAAGAWQWGIGEGMRALERTERPCLALTNRLFLPHIFVLFFGRIDPREYQAHPIQTITQSDMTYERFEIGRWHILPLSEALARPECAVLSLTDERVERRGVAGLHVVDRLYGPGGEHFFDISVRRDQEDRRAPSSR